MQTFFLKQILLLQAQGYSNLGHNLVLFIFGEKYYVRDQDRSRACANNSLKQSYLDRR